MNKKTCCPSFPIRCDAEHFRVSKTHKKVLHVVANFLMRGETPSDAKKARDACIAPISSGDSLFDQSDATSSPPRGEESHHHHTSDNMSCRKPTGRTGSTDSGINGSGSEAQTPARSEFSKQKRWQTQQKCMAQRAEKSGVPYEEIMKTYPQSRQDRSEKNKPKAIEDYLQQDAPKENAAHTLDVC